MRRHFDIAIVGSGFAGSLMAMVAKRTGHSVVLIDRGRHPRVVIGESSTPLANLLLEELSQRYHLPALEPLTKWGSWQRQYPDLACGLKRGFTFYHHNRERPWPGAPDRNHQLLVAASPSDHVADTHWYRADFDHFLVRQAQQLDVEYFDETNLTRCNFPHEGVHLDGTRRGLRLRFSADFLIDASGPRGCLHKLLGLEEGHFPGYPRTQALYSHFSGVRRLESLPFGQNDEKPPYPIDDAAVHHLFKGGWVWVLQFNNGITSAGVAATAEAASHLKLSQGAPAWRRLLATISGLEQQFARSEAQQAFTHLSCLPFLTSAVAGDRWALLPSTAGSVDPLLSTGFPLTLLGIERLGRLLETKRDPASFKVGLCEYAKQTKDELLATARLIAGLYASMDDFPRFSALTLLYFAAASFSETTRRLHKPSCADSFLLEAHPTFRPAMRKVLDRSLNSASQEDSSALIAEIYQAIEPFNIAGLGERERRNWYPVLPQDLIDSGPKLHASREEIELLLEVCGLRVQAGAPTSGSISVSQP